MYLCNFLLFFFIFTKLPFYLPKSVIAMNFTSDGSYKVNITAEFINLVKDLNLIAQFREENWFFTLLTKKLIVIINGSLSAIALIANLMVILGEYYVKF